MVEQDTSMLSIFLWGLKEDGLLQIKHVPVDENHVRSFYKESYKVYNQKIHECTVKLQVRQKRQC